MKHARDGLTFVDGKFKRTDKPHTDESEADAFAFEEESQADGEPKVLENLRLIR